MSNNRAPIFVKITHTSKIDWDKQKETKSSVRIHFSLDESEMRKFSEQKIQKKKNTNAQKLSTQSTLHFIIQKKYRKYAELNLFHLLAGRSRFYRKLPDYRIPWRFLKANERKLIIGRNYAIINIWTNVFGPPRFGFIWKTLSETLNVRKFNKNFHKSIFLFPFTDSTKKAKNFFTIAHFFSHLRRWNYVSFSTPKNLFDVSKLGWA